MSEGRRATFAHRAEYLALRGFVAAIAALPWNAASRIGGAIGRLGYRPLRIRRDVVMRQIAAAFPERSRADVASVARAAYTHLGRLAIETALLQQLDREHVIALVDELEGWELLEQAQRAGNGAIIVTGHLGNWELGGAYIVARGLRLEVIARRMGNPLFDRYLTTVRERTGMAVIYDHDAVGRVPRALREGHLIAFLSDQGVIGLASTFVPFFGRPAKTPRGAAVFALRFGSPVLFATCLRKPSGRFRLVIERVEAERSGDRELDVDRLVAAYTATLERWVRHEPGQYFWHHRRWRRQPPDTPVELREP